MNITRFEKETAHPAHKDTMLASPIIPEGKKTPFSHSWGYREELGENEYHGHAHEEIYMICKGNGIMIVEGEEQPVSEGDVIFLESYEKHCVRNITGEPLLWACFWWDKIED